LEAAQDRERVTKLSDERVVGEPRSSNRDVRNMEGTDCTKVSHSPKGKGLADFVWVCESAKMIATFIRENALSIQLHLIDWLLRDDGDNM
jgi:hypothetical protein